MALAVRSWPTSSQQHLHRNLREAIPHFQPWFLPHLHLGLHSWLMSRTQSWVQTSCATTAFWKRLLDTLTQLQVQGILSYKNVSLWPTFSNAHPAQICSHTVRVSSSHTVVLDQEGWKQDVIHLLWSMHGPAGWPLNACTLPGKSLTTCWNLASSALLPATGPLL